MKQSLIAYIWEAFLTGFKEGLRDYFRPVKVFKELFGLNKPAKETPAGGPHASPN